MSKRHVPKEVSRAIHEKAAPVITWLRTAEEESSDSDGGGASSEDDVEVVYSDRQDGAAMAVQVVAVEVGRRRQSVLVATLQ